MKRKPRSWGENRELSFWNSQETNKQTNRQTKENLPKMEKMEKNKVEQAFQEARD